MGTTRSNGLGRLAGRWSEEEYRQFECAVAPFADVDLREFLDNPVVKVLAVDEQVSRHFADIVVDLRCCGTPLPSNDIWIAATAVAASVPVLTCDGHFERIARVGSVILPS